MTSTATARTYTIDPSHSDVAFAVRHMMLSKVRGSFRVVAGSITLGATDVPTAIDAEIAVASIDTNDEKRDEHLRSPDFFDAATHTHMRFRSTAITPKDATSFTLAGELEIHGTSQPVVFAGEIAGHTKDPWGNDRIAYSASTRINRKDFGLVWNQALDAGGLLVGEDVDITLEIQAVGG